MEGFMNKLLILILVIVIFISGCRPTRPPANEDSPIAEKPSPIPEKAKDPIEEMVKSMTIEEKIGQLLIVGLEGTEISQNEIYNIRENKIGGFILFSRNIANKNQLLELIKNLNVENKDNKAPIFLSVDEEGGIVSRLSPIINNLRNPSWLGKVDDKELSFKYGENLGLKLSSFGFNLDFAPILDIDSNPSNPVIGNRAYGKSPLSVSDHGLAVMEGIKSKGIIPVAKHFPGHGDTSIDSHLELPLVQKSKEELKKNDLVPFKNAVDKGLDIIMVAHILYPEIDVKNPSTMSKIIIEDLLRQDMGFKGVVISDDMTMGAIINNYRIEEAAFSFLKAGGDIILICHGEENPGLVLDRIKLGIDNNQISMEEINKKVYRVLRLKDKYKLDYSDIIDVDIEKINEDTKKVNNKLR
ncbi:beta-N-acetylhexosaminidase [Tissierella creatinini]|nr:beta-N-acetylhexosaminidase [Tissierella creatinini]TJX66731.1 beta-N-acetylhexosaminidase [Soehngenia saccharolytica]